MASVTPGDNMTPRSCSAATLRKPVSKVADPATSARFLTCSVVKEGFAAFVRRVPPARSPAGSASGVATEEGQTPVAGLFPRLPSPSDTVDKQVSNSGSSVNWKEGTAPWIIADAERRPGGREEERKAGALTALTTINTVRYNSRTAGHSY